MAISNPSFSVIPTPKSFLLREGYLVAKHSSRGFQILCETAFQKSGTAEIAASELAAISGGKSRFGAEEASNLTIRFIRDHNLPNSSEEAYRICIGDIIELSVRADAGLLYGIATLRQLGKRNAEGRLEFPRCEIEDFPDVPYRFASRWLIELECSRMAYDWGDGRENMLARYRHKIDFCMRYKINAAFFEGFEWITDKYPEYLNDMSGLNAYARARNVRLAFGGHVIGFGGYPGHTKEGAKGLGGFNRVSYPNGAIYDCGRLPGPFDPHHAVITSDAPRNGTCRSNEALNRLKQADLADYVRKVEPGVLYLHSEDISLYEEFRLMWIHRCPACHERWPNDALAAADGAAGAVAYGFQRLLDGVASVYNPETEYDAARDCKIIFCSPTYGAYYDDDAAWDQVADFWTTISSLLGHSDRVQFGMREQFWRRDGTARRLPELAKRLATEGGGHGIFAFVVGGADLYNNSSLFSAAPRLNHFCEGSTAIFNFNGGLFTPVQEIYNSEYTWNLLSPYGVDKAADYESAKTIYLDRSVHMAYLSQDELFKKALQLCHGEAAAEMEEFYYLRDEDSNFPLAIPFLLCRQLFRKPFEEFDSEKLWLQWRGICDVTIRAGEIITRALTLSAPEVGTAAELRYLRACLEFGVRFSGIVADCFSPTADFEALPGRIHDLKTFVLQNYPRNFTSPFEGEMNLWMGYLDKLSNEINKRAQSHLTAR